MTTASQSLVVVTIASHHLLALAESLKFYPADVDPDEALGLRDTLMREVSRELEDAQWEETRKLIEEEGFDAFQHTEVISVMLGLGIALLAKPKSVSDIQPEEILKKAYQAIPPSLGETLERVQEILIFNCRTPNPSAGADFIEVSRFFFLLTKYWILYRDILMHHGTAPIGYVPHPLLRFIINLKERMETCLLRIGDAELSNAINGILEISFDQDSNMAYEEWVQPKIQAASEIIERSCLRFRRQSFSLTKAEDLFVRVANEALRNLEVRTNSDWQKILARVDKTLTPT
jgi:hypothetical protein